MASMNIDTDEARLITVFRQIKRLDKDDLISVSEVGGVLQLLEEICDLEKMEEDLPAAQLKQAVYGFVAGIAASRFMSIANSQLDSIESGEEMLPDEIANQTVSGGPTGGVVAGQSRDPRYISQTGPRDESVE